MLSEPFGSGLADYAQSLPRTRSGGERWELRVILLCLGVLLVGARLRAMPLLLIALFPECTQDARRSTGAPVRR